jgi:hypothetical protein
MECNGIVSDADEDVNILAENIGKYCAEWHINSACQ